MKLLSFRTGGRESFGALLDRGVVDLGTREIADLRSALAHLTLEELQRRAAAATGFLPLADLTLLPPIPVPDKILCVGLNYRRHLLETGARLPEKPSLFVRFSGSQVGHEQPIVRPSLSPMFDFEGELAVVIGRAGRHIPPERAFDHIAGYACFADNSLRDYQRHSTQATAGKNFDRSGGFGPWLVTADEVPDFASQTLVTRLNGQEVQRTGLDDMIFPIADLIAYASAFTRLLPGDVIATGTPDGVGMARTPPLWMQAGDVLEIEISAIGTLRHTVIDETPENWSA